MRTGNGFAAFLIAFVGTFFLTSLITQAGIAFAPPGAGAAYAIAVGAVRIAAWIGLMWLALKLYRRLAVGPSNHERRL